MPWRLERLVVFWVLLVAAMVVVIASAVEAFTANPQQGEGWIGGPIQAIFAGGPLIAVAIGLRSTRREVARKTAVGALLLAIVVEFVLVIQLLDPNEITRDRLVQGLGLLVYLAAFVVELPAFTEQWPPSEQSKAAKSQR